MTLLAPSLPETRRSGSLLRTTKSTSLSRRQGNPSVQKGHRRRTATRNEHGFDTAIEHSTDTAAAHMLCSVLCQICAHETDRKQSLLCRCCVNAVLLLCRCCVDAVSLLCLCCVAAVSLLCPCCVAECLLSACCVLAVCLLCPCCVFSLLVYASDRLGQVIGKSDTEQILTQIDTD